MRVADCSATRTYLNQLNKAKSDFMTTQAQIFTGNRFTQLSDDVSSGVRVMNTRTNLYKAETYYSNINEIQDELSLAEDVLLDIQDILTRAHELTLEALNADKEDSKEIIAAEIASLKDQLLYLANSSFGDLFTFGGTNSSSSEPFTLDENGRVNYNGIPVDDIKVADTDLSDDITAGSYYYLNDDGDPVKIPMDEDIYMDVGLGIKMTESQVNGNSVVKISFSGLDIFGFGTNDDGLSNNLFNILDDLENAILDYDTDSMSSIDLHFTDLRDSFLTNITDIGAKTKYLDTILTRTERNIDMYKISIDELMGTKDEEAISTLAMNEYVLKAVQQMGSRVLPNTLMDFIR